MGFSVVLAKIATHLDQVVDVFYVTDLDGEKITDGDKLKAIQNDLLAAIGEFEHEGHLLFAP
jgi:[protein-PII] uridylyltransferase